MKNQKLGLSDLTIKIEGLENKTEALRLDGTKAFDKLEEKIDKKHIPLNLEGEILRTAQQSINEAVKSALGGYGSPLTKLVLEVVNENAAFLKEIISSSFNEVIRTEDFKQSIVSAFSHKVARSIISNNDGLFDKVSNDLKQDAVFKSKMALAVANVVEECLKK